MRITTIVSAIHRPVWFWLVVPLLWLGVGTGVLAASPAGSEALAILSPPEAGVRERLAAREVRRYLYLRTGRVLPILSANQGPAWAKTAIVVAQKDRPLVRQWAGGYERHAAVADLKPQDFWLRTLGFEGRRIVWVVGGDDVGTLYAAYRFAEHLGVRFYLHGETIPDEWAAPPARRGGDGKGAEQLAGAAVRSTALTLPEMNELARPLFDLRGIQPFHDFPEGPDWWNRDDYLAIISQLPKLRMNFFGLHTYPEANPNAEPTVWIGQPGDVGDQGRVKFSYPASYQNTLRGNWGYRAKKTSDYYFGASNLFERDDFGPEVMFGHMPNPKTPEAYNEVFDRTAALLREAFQQAQRLGLKTCVGTETPLTVPKLLQQRLKDQGKAHTNLLVVQELYEGMFRRIAQAYPLDYYWFWTPEDWTWKGVKEEHIRRTTNDLFAALAAHRQLQPPFKLATCGWVLGPPQDRALFDKVLPKDVAISCINREVGRTPVERGFVEVQGRGKWAIPWLEDDPALTAPQLWVGRMRRDAADARRYGCDGLMGIHWRTRVLGPAVAALAQAAWNQEPWNQSLLTLLDPPKAPGPVGGKYADFPKNEITDTDEDPLYQTVRYDVSAYHLPMPNGRYTVILKFCEPNYDKPEKRVFDVKLQGVHVIGSLDIFAKVGKNRALDHFFDHVMVTNGWLSVEFVPRTEYPSIAGLVVQGEKATLKINCGGPAYRDYVADWPPVDKAKPKFPPTEDFYQDWSLNQFGKEVARPAAAIFQKMDGNLPRPADWVEGPGGIRPDKRPWAEVRKEYAFVDELAALEPKVVGAGHRERFDYWLNTFRYLRAMGELNCAWALYTNAMGKVKAEPDPDKQKDLARQTVLPLRRELVRLLVEVYQPLLATISNPGELGTLANWEQHLLPDLLVKPGQELAKLLGEEALAQAQPPDFYSGPIRVIVPAMRTSLLAGEAFRLKVLLLAEQPLRELALYWRPMGKGSYTAVPLKLVARGVYSVQLPADAGQGADLEYYIKAVSRQGQPVYFPATAPQLNQTVVRMSDSR